MAGWKPIDGWELVVGLEVHVELNTQTKIFCGCPTAYGAEPNTQCCPVCMGYPGALPVLNAEVVHFAAVAGMALGCEVALTCHMDRKNYFYPDLPKAYQISQFDQPLCTGGGLVIDTPQGRKRIGITRIHMEEDAGKLIHDDQQGTLVDYNRAGVPLIEIVSEPDIRTPEEAVRYVEKLRAIIAYTGVSDCRMNEGSLRCDVNLSVRRPGEKLGTRTEMKNLNSFQSVQRAIESEYRRQVEAVKRGEIIVQETRRYDQATGTTSCMRRKENADDYRYYPEPDMLPVALTQVQLAAWRSGLPELPDVRMARYMQRWGITEAAAAMLVRTRETAEYFEEAAAQTSAVKTLVNLMTTEVFRLMPGEEEPIRIAPQHLARTATMTDEGRINGGTAKKILAALWEHDEDPEKYAERNGLMQLTDAETLLTAVKNAVHDNPAMVEGYRKGKINLKQALMGAAVKALGGRADPVALRKMLDAELDS